MMGGKAFATSAGPEIIDAAALMTRTRRNAGHQQKLIKRKGGTKGSPIGVSGQEGKKISDRQRFVETVGEDSAEAGWQVHACVLMPDHFHLVVETPQPNLVAGMKWLLGTYTSRFNRRHKLFGHLFSGRYKSLIVDGSGSGYLKSVCDYVHLNPARAKLVAVDAPLRSFAWSSWSAYLLAPSKGPAWLRVDRLLGEWASRRTVQPGGNGWGRRWRNGVGRRRARNSSRSGAAGVWARKSFAKSCWRR